MKMKDSEAYNSLIKRIKAGHSKVRAKKWSLSDYYFDMCDFFKQIEPSKGYHQGVQFNFKEDAEEFKQLAIKENENERQ